MCSSVSFITEVYLINVTFGNMAGPSADKIEKGKEK